MLGFTRASLPYRPHTSVHQVNSSDPSATDLLARWLYIARSYTWGTGRNPRLSSLGDFSGLILGINS